MKDGFSKILLVEDNDDDAFLTRRPLEAAGISPAIQHCHDGQEAIDYLQGLLPEPGSPEALKSPPLMLVDLKMPRVNGLEVLSWIRNHEVFSPLLVLILTSSSEERDVTKAYRLHVNAYLVKPASQKEMTEMARSIRHFWLDQSHLVNPSLATASSIEIAGL